MEKVGFRLKLYLLSSSSLERPSFEDVLFQKRVGWLYEAYFLCKKLHPDLSVAHFDFASFSSGMFEDFPKI
jgi:hypothetical protein